VSVDVKGSRWDRLGPIARFRPLLAAVNGGLDLFRANLSGLIEPKIEIKPGFEIDPKDFKEDNIDDPAKDPFRVIVTDARGKPIKVDVTVDSGAVVVSPDGLILVAAVRPQAPLSCATCDRQGDAEISEAELQKEFDALLQQAQAEVMRLLPGATPDTVLAIRKELLGTLLNEPASSLDWELDVRKRVDTQEDPAAYCDSKDPITGETSRRPCPPLRIKLDLQPAQFFCDDLCNAKECKIDCSARERCTPYLVSLGEKAAGDLINSCPIKDVKTFVTKAFIEGCERVCDLLDPLGLACRDVGCRTVTRVVEEIIKQPDPVCEQARLVLKNTDLLTVEGGALTFARLMGVEKQYAGMCSALNSVTEKPLCEGLKLTAKPACQLAEDSLNAAINVANTQLRTLEHRYAGSVE
jgi:hypothetical protein